VDWTDKPSLNAFDAWCLAPSTPLDAFERAMRSVPHVDWPLLDGRISARLFGDMPEPPSPATLASAARAAALWRAKQDAFIAERQRRDRNPGPG
jgi:hypothetical protein